MTNFIKKFFIWLFLGGVVLASGGVADSNINPYEQVGDVYSITKAERKVEIKEEGEYITANLTHWDGEVSLKVKRKLKDKDKLKRDVLSKKLKVKNSKEEINLYPLDPTDQMEDGGFEFEVILYERPESNIVILEIETQDIRFDFQPPLNEENNPDADYCTATECFKDGERIIYRPENVVGAYAVSALKPKVNWAGGKVYGTGMIGTIFRPKIFDSAGNWTWGINSIDEEKGTLSVETPQEFLDNAVYPIRHAAGFTFGNSAGGATTWLMGFNSVRSFQAQTPTDGDGVLVSISLFSNVADSGDFRGVLYLNSDKSLVGDAGTAVDGAEFDWAVSTMNGETIINNTSYDIAAWLGVANWNARYTSLAPDTLRDAITYSATGNPNDPFETDTTYTNRRLAIYATYEAAGGGGADYNPNLNRVIITN